MRSQVGAVSKPDLRAERGTQPSVPAGSGAQPAPVSAPGTPLTGDAVLTLQRAAGNDAASRAIAAHRIAGGSHLARSREPTSARDPKAPSRGRPRPGEAVNKIGIVNWDGSPKVRLRAQPSTESDIVAALPFNTRVQVMRRVGDGWFQVATEDGGVGYVAATYVWTRLPEPTARLHRVEGGIAGTAIAIAEHYFKPYADDWGQDLRFYVNVLAHVNGISVPDTTSGWEQVRFQAGRLVWVPGHSFARGLRGIVGSGSRSHDVLEAVGLAGALDRAEELLRDFSTAVELSGKYGPKAIARHVEASLRDVVGALVALMLVAVGILAVGTAVGAAVGGGAGAAIGFNIAMAFLEWMGLAFLVIWLAKAIVEITVAFGRFVSTVWKARGDITVVDRGAVQFAEAIAILIARLLEALVMFAAAKGIGAVMRLLRGTRFGRALGESRLINWLERRLGQRARDRMIADVKKRLDAIVPRAAGHTGTRRAAGELHLDGAEPRLFKQKAGETGYRGRSEITQPERHILRPEAEGAVPTHEPAKTHYLEKHRLPESSAADRPEGPYTRAHDAEAKVLEEVSASLKKDAKGTLYLRPSHTPCAACTDAMFRFTAQHPGIKVILL